MSDGEHGDFVIKINEAFDNDFSSSGAAAFLRVLPGFFDVGGGFDYALTVAGGTHDWLNHARRTDFRHRLQKFLFAGGKTVRRSL